MTKHPIPILFLCLLIAACQGNVHGEYGGKFESTTESSHTVTVNGKKVREEHSKSKTGSGFEGDFNVNFGEQDSVVRVAPFPARIECGEAMPADKFEAVKSELLQVTTDKNKILHLKRTYPRACFSSAQVRDVAALFTMDKYRLDFAKSFYGHTSDRMNYYKVRDAMRFDESKQQLDDFVNEW